jgi:hypothetical protein
MMAFYLYLLVLCAITLWSVGFGGQLFVVGVLLYLLFGGLVIIGDKLIGEWRKKHPPRWCQ